MRKLKLYETNADGVNVVACTAYTKKEALQILGVTAHSFKSFGHIIEDENFVEYIPYDAYPYYRPNVFSQHYPWRRSRYRLCHNAQGMSYYE